MASSLPTTNNSALIDRHIASGKEIWILNRSKSLILLEFRDSLGSSMSFRIPPEEKPLCLSQYFPPTMIKDNPNLRRLISAGHLSLLDPDLMEGKESVKPLASIADTRKDNAVEERAQAQEALVPEEDVIEANAKVAYLCELVKTKEMKTKDMIDKLEGEDLVEADYAYVINELKGDDKAVGWATEKLADLREAGGGGDEVPAKLETSDAETSEGEGEKIVERASRAGITGEDTRAERIDRAVKEKVQGTRLRRT